MLRRFLRFVPAVLWAALLFYLSAQEDLPRPPLFFDGIDKIEHAVAYGILAGLLVFGAGRPAWKWAGVAVLYGVTDELHQYFVPGRSCSVFDLAADASGAFLAVALWFKWQQRMLTKR